MDDKEIEATQGSMVNDGAAVKSCTYSGGAPSTPSDEK
jgi:hypothetical protein